MSHVLGRPVGHLIDFIQPAAEAGRIAARSVQRHGTEDGLQLSPLRGMSRAQAMAAGPGELPAKVEPINIAWKSKFECL